MKIDQNSIEGLAEEVASRVRGATANQIKKILEVKLKDPALGYRRIGKLVALNKDKVREIWGVCEHMLSSVKLAPKESEKALDEGEFYATAFLRIEKYEKKGFKPRNIAIELVKELKTAPEKAGMAVKKYFGLEDLDALDELWEQIDDISTDIGTLRRSVELGLRSPGRYKRDKCEQFRKLDGLCAYWQWNVLPSNPSIRSALVKAGDKWRLKVSEHPEHCATCQYKLESQRSTKSFIYKPFPRLLHV